jgi:hypothetical protein
VDDRNVGTFSGTTTVCDLGSLNSSAKTELDLLREEIQHRISLLKSIDDQINVDEEHGAKHGANQSHLVDENMLFSDDDNVNQQFDDPLYAAFCDDNQLPLGEDEGSHRLDQGAGLQGDDSYPINFIYFTMKHARLRWETKIYVH